MSSPIQAGASIPAIPVKELAADGPEPFVLKGKNIIVRICDLCYIHPSADTLHAQVGVPGAFTGTCSAQVPGYINALKKFQEKGVNGIYVVAINDVFVTKCVAHSRFVLPFFL